MAERAIIHSDMNSFYASVEMMLNPSLKGKPIAVCGSTEERHGIVLAKSELAKKSGVKTGMANWEARKVCKNLIVVPPQYDQYLKFSKLAHSIYQRYTDLIEPFGMDEVWADLTDSIALHGSPMSIAEEIRQTIREELGLTVSIGVSFNKVFAKLGSDYKKPDAITEISPNNFKDIVWPLPASDMIYCGRASTKKLAYYGIHTIGDLAAADHRLLKRILGVNGMMLWGFANGFDSSRVAHKDYVSPIKSIGHGITCVSNLTNEQEVWRVILELCQDIGHRLMLHNLAATSVQICIICDELHFYQFQCPLLHYTQLPSEIARAAFSLFQKHYLWNNDVRAITVRGIKLIPKPTVSQTSFFSDTKQILQKEQLQNTIEAIRSRFGKHSITYAQLLGDKKMPMDGREKVMMPTVMYQ